MRLNDEERALFDAILAGAANQKGFDGDDAGLAKAAAQRGEAFIIERRKHVEESSS